MKGKAQEKENDMKKIYVNVNSGSLTVNEDNNEEYQTWPFIEVSQSDLIEHFASMYRTEFEAGDDTHLFRNIETYKHLELDEVLNEDSLAELRELQHELKNRTL